MDTYDSPEVLAIKARLSLGMELYKRKRIYADIRKQRLAEARQLGTHTSEQWDALLSQFGHRCARCGCMPSPRPCKDHITPVSRGGSDHITNLQPLCRECNTAQADSAFNWVDYRARVGFGEVSP